jgi:hypothetical protein
MSDASASKNTHQHHERSRRDGNKVNNSLPVHCHITYHDRIERLVSKHRLVGHVNGNTDNAIVATVVNAYVLEIAKMQILWGT